MCMSCKFGNFNKCQSYVNLMVTIKQNVDLRMENDSLTFVLLIHTRIMKLSIKWKNTCILSSDLFFCQFSYKIEWF